MLYRVIIDLTFTNKAPQEALKNHALGMFQQAITINPHSPHSEHSYILTQDCTHHESSPAHCIETFKKETP